MDKERSYLDSMCSRMSSGASRGSEYPNLHPEKDIVSPESEPSDSTKKLSLTSSTETRPESVTSGEGCDSLSKANAISKILVPSAAHLPSIVLASSSVQEIKYKFLIAAGFEPLEAKRRGDDLA
jgi:hypothetical protein